jgi:hypothetical protein
MSMDNDKMNIKLGHCMYVLIGNGLMRSGPNSNYVCSPVAYLRMKEEEMVFNVELTQCRSFCDKYEDDGDDNDGDDEFGDLSIKWNAEQILL